VAGGGTAVQEMANDKSICCLSDLMYFQRGKFYLKWQEE
jgi:hypothetical protein